MSLNAIRSYISINAKSKGYIFGIFYGGVAIFSSLGALSIGYIWKIYGINTVLEFSVIGMVIMLLVLIIKVDKNS